MQKLISHSLISKIIVYLLSIILLTQIPFLAEASSSNNSSSSSSVASSYDDDESYGNNSGSSGGLEGFLEWIFEQILSFILGFFVQCKEVPEFNSFARGSVQLALEQGEGRWVSTGIEVKGGKAINLNWTTKGLVANVRKYMIMYRIDPRFVRPQIFILKYNYLTRTYDSDFHNYGSGRLVSGGENINPQDQAFVNRVQDLNNYFNFVERSKIALSPGDVLNISLVGMDEFVNKSLSMTGELDQAVGGLLSIYSSTGIPDNKIMYLDAVSWCQGGAAQEVAPYICGNNSNIVGDPNSYYYNSQNYLNRIVGRLDLNPSRIPSIPSCPVNAIGSNFQTPRFSSSVSNYSYNPCFYDKGRTMVIKNGSKVIKQIYQPFTHSSFSGIDFFHYNVKENGFLEFFDPSISLPVNNIFYRFAPNIDSWANNYGTNLETIRNYLAQGASEINNSNSKILYGGRYIMEVVIGNGNVGNFNQQNDVRVEYQIVPNQSNGSPGVARNGGISIPQDFRTNASRSGVLWVRVINPNTEVSGNIHVGYAYYRGSTFLSDVIYNAIINPVKDVILKTSRLFYSALVINPSLQLVIRILLTFYIILQTLYFLAGMRNITLESLLVDIFKIIVVIAMLSDTSWNLFYHNVFKIFLEGMNYLFTNVVGLTSNVNNPFGFVDIIFTKYTDWELWSLILTALLSITNGLTILAIIVIHCILKFLSIVLDVVVAYVFAYVVIAVLIAMAPLFIICMLFETTRSIFDNWISLMFNYMIQPTVLIIFFLIIDQLMTNQLTLAIPRACWDYLIRFQITIPAGPLGTWHIAIPLFEGIPGFVPQASSAVVPGPSTYATGTFLGLLMGTFMFYLYTQIAQGLNAYVTQLVNALTNSASGSSEGGGSPVQNISKQVKDLGAGAAKIASAPARFVGRELKEKFWDGKVKKPQSTAQNPSDSKANDAKADGASGDSNTNPLVQKGKGQSDNPLAPRGKL